MSKGEHTRQHIIIKSANLFNKKGYAGTAMSHIMDATGLEKGGIYNHFPNKNAIALEAFDYAMQQLNQHMSEAVEGIESPLERLIIFIKSFGVYRDEDWIEGGCPIMNTAIDADDTHEELRDKALDALKLWEHIISRRLEKAIALGEARSDTDIVAFATLAISSLEGAVMLSRIHDDFTHLNRVIAHLINVIERDIKISNE